MNTLDTAVETPIRKTVKGEYVRLKNTDTAPVWVRGHYDRVSKSYALYRADDVNHETFVKGTRKVFVGFTY